MSAATEFYIGQLKLEVIDDAYVVEVSFVDHPPWDLPEWTLYSRNAIWFFQGDQPITTRAEYGDVIQEGLASGFLH